MIRTLIVIGAGIVLAAPVARAGPEALREQSEKTVSSRGIHALEVRNARGLVSVRPGPDDRVRVTALKIVKGGTERQARELAAATHVVADASGDRFSVRVDYPQRRRIQIGFWDLLTRGDIPRVEVRLAFEVPAGLPVSLKSTSGDLTIDGLAGPQKLETVSGDIEVGRQRGPLAAGTVSGDVSVSEFAGGSMTSVSGDIHVGRSEGPVSARTTSGEIVLGVVADSVRAMSVSGDVRVERATRSLTAHSTSGGISVRGSGRLDVETSSGDVQVTADAPLAGARVSTVSGEIVLRLGGRLGCALEARSASGSIDVSVPLDMRSVARRRVAGTVRGGSAPVVLRSSSGDIHVQN